MVTAESADSVVVLDFETTGLSPGQGDRAIEIGAVKLHQGQVVDRFQQLMNPGFRVSGFIESYTGISNAMLSAAPGCAEVMDRFADFITGANLVAHNASFDQRFLDAELAAIGRNYQGGFACSMLIARRWYPQAPNHKLGSLVAYRQIENDGVFHRALADSEMTARLWMMMVNEMQQRHRLAGLQFSQLQKLAKTPKAKIDHYLASLAR
ncbi:3'-5' exonuclease [Ferrimonas kyonanensis]|uniref:3'-5' exonuclease n=1 Tax=Ferrimonas kyonanensis TaxID=364763 RepID=UPI00040D84FC|nr:3'-5' exonuclease [Ferrimonas kyonanensis]